MLTGAGGFLGQAVVNKFSQCGYEVRSLRSVTKFNNIDEWVASTESEILSFEPGAVINIGAAQNGGDSLFDIVELTTSNLICPSMIASILKNAKFQTQLITIASSWQYGSDGSYSPFNLYAASKQSLDNYLHHYAMDGLIATSLILFDTFGPNDSRRKIHKLIADSVSNKTELDMTGGDQLINLVHIDDAADAVYTAFLIRQTSNYIASRLIKWAIKNDKSIKVKQLLTFLSPEQRVFIKLGRRPYRNREVFEIFDGFKTVPGWAPEKDIVLEMSMLFNEHE